MENWQFQKGILVYFLIGFNLVPMLALSKISLKELNIKLGSFNIGGKPEDVLKNSSVEKITIEPNGSLSWLKNFPQIKSLSLGARDYYAKKATDYDSFNYLINLEELEISCGSEENIDFLKNCVNIKKLTLNFRVLN